MLIKSYKAWLIFHITQKKFLCWHKKQAKLTILYCPIRKPQFSGQRFDALCSWPMWSFLFKLINKARLILKLNTLKSSVELHFNELHITVYRSCSNVRLKKNLNWVANTLPTRSGPGEQNWIPFCFSQTPWRYLSVVSFGENFDVWVHFEKSASNCERRVCSAFVVLSNRWSTWPSVVLTRSCKT